MDLSISIVSWNVKEHLRTCLKSIYDTVNNLFFEVIVVDNNSSDGTVQMIKDGFTPIKLIENKRNYGFAAANNQAIKRAEGRYILLLNPDTIVLPGVIEGMMHFMDSRPEAGISSCRGIDENGNPDPSELLMREYDPFSFKFYNFLKGQILKQLSYSFPDNKTIKKNIFAHSLTSDFKLFNNEDMPVEFNVVHGFFMMIKKSLFKQIEEFDEKFFFSGEDYDFCYRAKKAGVKIYLCPQYEIIHLKEKSIKQWSKKDRQDATTYSRYIFFGKHKGKIWLSFEFFKILCAKVIVRAFALVSDLILWVKKSGKSSRGNDENEIVSTPISIELKNLLRVIFNISPRFNY